MSQANDEATIRGIIERWVVAVRARDLDGVLANHADGMLLFDVPLPVQARGIDRYRESWEQFFESVPEPIAFDVGELSIAAGDDVAFAHGIIHCQSHGDQPEELNIRLTIGLQKSGGRWIVMHEHHSEAIP